MERKTLFEQVQFPKLTLKNRFVRSGLWMKAADEQGHITPDLVDTYKALADGGVGLIITEYTYIDANDQPNPRMIGMYDDSFIPEWNEIITPIPKMSRSPARSRWAVHKAVSRHLNIAG